MDELFVLVQREIDRQNELWSDDRALSDTWVSRLGEEFGEVCRANNERDARQYIIELSHVAAVAIQAMNAIRKELKTDHDEHPA